MRQLVSLTESDLYAAPDAADGTAKNCCATNSSKTQLASTLRIF